MKVCYMASLESLEADPNTTRDLLSVRLEELSELLLVDDSLRDGDGVIDLKLLLVIITRRYCKG